MKPNDLPEEILLTALRAASDWPVNTLDDSPPEFTEFMRLGLAAVLLDEEPWVMPADEKDAEVAPC